MAIGPGTRVGPYKVTALLGEGGMGTVWSAHHTALKRDDALKVLPDAFAADAERLARFHREAQVLASLNHPNIAHVYGLEDTDGVRALVMELVEGPTLADRITAGSIQLDEALHIARQIAEALEAAHDRGIIHRDLKPSNVKIRPDGTAKVLDFGLAKAMAPAGATSPHVSQSPTITTPAMTQAGVLLGTAAYMSPEQARGRSMDRRTDVWAFGCVLYEMLTGARVFHGSDVTDIIVSVVSREPDWEALPTDVPSTVRRLLRRCLEKDPKRRLDSAATLRIEIDDALSAPAADSRDVERVQTAWHTPATGVFGTGPSRIASVALVAVASAATAAALMWILTRERGTAPAAVIRTLVSVAPAEGLRADPLDSTSGEGRPSRTAFALSPDGRSLVFSGTTGNRQQLFLRTLDQLHASAIAGTDGAHSPFFSPDGQWIAFQAGRTIKRVPLAGDTPPTAICDAGLLFGASWGTSGTIVFATERGGLFRVPAEGGTPQPVAADALRKGEYSHRLPHFLPDGDTVMFTIIGLYLPKWDDARLALVRLSTGERRDLIAGADARFVTTGHLIFLRSGSLAAVPFDESKLQVTGSPIVLLDDVMQAGNMTNQETDTGAGQIALSESGDLAYVPGGIFPDVEKIIVVSDRQGRVQVLPIPLRPFFAPLLSPDDERLVVWTQGVDRNVWTYDLARGTLTRLTTEGRNHRGIWTPDGKRITYAGGTAGRYSLMIRPADGSGPPELLTAGITAAAPSTWSPDGQTLLFRDFVPGPTGDENAIMAVSLTGDRQPRVVLQSRSFLAYPELSADGNWLAFVSSESGRGEVYVQPYPGPGPRHQISTNGGTAPAWARNGREMFYTSTMGSSVRMMSVPVALSPFKAGFPRVLFEGPYALQAVTRGYSVSADGQRFYLTQRKERPPVRVTQMVLVQNWGQELKRHVPAR